MREVWMFQLEKDGAHALERRYAADACRAPRHGVGDGARSARDLWLREIDRLDFAPHAAIWEGGIGCGAIAGAHAIGGGAHARSGRCRAMESQKA